MYIPGISPSRRSTLVERARKLEKRRGGGGRGGGGGGGGRSTGGGGTTGGGGRTGARSASSSDKPPPYSPGSPPPPYSVSGGAAVRGTPGGAGGGRQYNIQPGNTFAGRSAGGGTRGQIYSGRGYGAVGFLPFFPFMFWPLYFPLYPGYYGGRIYGPENNDTRPGGFLQSFTLLPDFTTNATSDSASIPSAGTAPPTGNAFAIYGDNSTVADMVSILGTNCSVYQVYGSNISVTPFNAVQYYRGSTFSLHLDGYNNTLPDIEVPSDENFTIPDVQPATLPSAVNQDYLNCVNETIGEYISLLDSDYVTDAAPRAISAASVPLVGTAALLVWALQTFF